MAYETWVKKYPEMLIEYIRKGYRGKRVVKDGISFVQTCRGPRIGVFVALDVHRFGWSLVHAKGANKEPVKDINWSKGVEMAILRAEGNGSTLGLSDKVPESIKKQFEDFKERATAALTEQSFPIEKTTLRVTVATNGKGGRNFSIAPQKGRGRIAFDQETFQNLCTAIHKALKTEFVVTNG
jgi:hypothetical protein